MRLLASAFVLSTVSLSIAACDRVTEPLTADPTPLTTVRSAQPPPQRCVKAWDPKPSREPFVAGFVAPDCPEKGDHLTPPSRKDPLRTITVVFPDAKGTSITAEVAEDPTDRQRGLMMRKSMPENRGMVFVFQGREVHEFWMHNT